MLRYIFLLFIGCFFAVEAREKPSVEEAKIFAFDVAKQVLLASQENGAKDKLIAIFQKEGDIQYMTKQALKGVLLDLISQTNSREEASKKLEKVIKTITDKMKVELPSRYATPANIEMVKNAQLVEGRSESEEGPPPNKSHIITLFFKQKSGADVKVRIEISKVGNALKVLGITLDAFDLIETVSKVYLNDFKNKFGGDINKFAEGFDQ